LAWGAHTRIAERLAQIAVEKAAPSPYYAQADDAGSDLFDMLSIAGVVDPREIALVVGIGGHPATYTYRSAQMSTGRSGA
jgi:hypothetical protein